MVNPQHIEWLNEGRDAWNFRRSTSKFSPDFSIERQGNTQRRFPGTPTELPRDLSGYNLSSACFDGCSLQGISFTGANLSNASLSFCYLGNSDFSNCNLKNAKIVKSVTAYTDFTGADLSGAVLDFSDFGTSYLVRASLKKASLNQTVLNTTKIDGLDVSDTDLSLTRNLRRDHYLKMIGNIGTKLPPRLPFPNDLWGNTARRDQENSTEQALESPIVKAASFDFEVDQRGVSAKLQDTHQVPRSALDFGCLNRTDALIANARSIADGVSNKLGEDTRRDLIEYANHLAKTDPANPHRLSFLAKGVAADLDDPLVSAGFNKRLVIQLGDFLDQHHSFLSECIPAAAQAIATKDAIEPSRLVSKEEATEVLNKLEEAILQAEAATDSCLQVIQGLRDHDDELNRFKLKIFSRADQEKLDQLVQRETVELSSITARLFWRTKEAYLKVRPYAGDGAIAATLVGTNVPDMARKIIEFLQPVMIKLQEIIPGLPLV
ncbi:pentapeptide repeat-containing protein [Leisingera aquaemixtae]|uniref:pentapeptide repeat-containing protein n=1 Tax=Leisingera aquaemixtae TaxID=1396826 RepID=UPI0021A2C53E|nr:pentapeptide repeat-containing protein [Leisingera aquaemixtae]UWQ23510.1 pentapeptide repeat-containing protein [Leisingera aquaemixtae]